MYTVQILKSACGTTMFTTEVTNETTLNLYYITLHYITHTEIFLS